MKNFKLGHYVIHRLSTVFAFALFLTFFASGAALAADSTADSDSSANFVGDRNTPSCTLELRFDGAITPGTLDYFQRGLKRAKELECRSILIHINTPGGGLPTTRTIVELILSSDIPILCLVSPSGGHAGSAGAIILTACHVNGAMAATNIGAATPIAGGGERLSEDLRKKLIEDTVSWTTGLAKLRGRNTDFARDIVSEAKALDAEAAQQIGAVDVVPGDVSRFLDFAEGRSVAMPADQKADVKIGALTPYEPDLRARTLQFLTDPQIAYLLFMASLALLYFEITNPGTLVPGIIGGIGLILAFIAFSQLDVYWGGVLLIALGLAMLIAEAFIPSFGALGIGGIAAVAGGSFLLYEPARGGPVLPLHLIVATSAFAGMLMLALGLFILHTRKKGKASNEVALIGHEGFVASLDSPSLRHGMVIVRGEYWRFDCDKDVHVGDRVMIVAQEKLKLRIRPI